MTKVIVIGGGAAGLTAAIYSAKEGNEVTILEKNANCGKKILVTGNGRCNYFNRDQSLYHFHTSSSNELGLLLNENNNREILNFFESIGIIPKIKNGYYYPMSNQATSINNALVLEAKLQNVDIKNNISVLDVEKISAGFKVITDYEEYYCDKVIVATGSMAAPKTGSDGFGYKLLQKLGHTIIKPLPALVQLVSNDEITAHWDGVRTEVICELFVDDEAIKKEAGEIMLTDYGVSGICIFNLSGEASKALNARKKVSVKVNFLSNLNIHNTLEWFNEYNRKVNDRTISELLDGLLNYKLVNAILKKLKIDKDTYWEDLSDLDKDNVVRSITNYQINITGTNSFDKAQVCSGGVSLSEINLDNMESKILPNLYIAGELLDVDGDCGGYNLTWAWISGMTAGKGTGKND